MAKKERECQALVQQALHQVQAETRTYVQASETSASLPKDENLVQWLQKLSVDPATTQTLLSHSFTLQNLLTCATQDDLVYTRIRGGGDCMPNLKSHLATASRSHIGHPWTAGHRVMTSKEADTDG